MILEWNCGLKSIIFLTSYRDLLDRWELYKERALFDINRQRMIGPNSNTQPSIFIRCSYCNQSISLGAKPPKTGFVPFTLVATVKPRSICCPTCSKALPRCSLCLMSLGTSFDTDSQGPLSKFDDWFTLCNTCQHGGHASHVYEWFQEHSSCPVSGCSCRCSTK